MDLWISLFKKLQCVYVFNNIGNLVTGCMCIFINKQSLQRNTRHQRGDGLTVVQYILSRSDFANQVGLSGKIQNTWLNRNFGILDK